MNKSPSYKEFLKEFPAIKKGQSYAEYCQLYFGNTAYENLGKKLTGKPGTLLFDEASLSLKIAWRDFNSTKLESDWMLLCDTMPYLFYMSLFPRELDISDQVGPDAPWEGGEG